MPVNPLDFTEELTQLLTHTSRLALYIRADGRALRYASNRKAAERIELIGDSLHNIQHIGEAVQQQDWAALAQACNTHIASHTEYQTNELYPSSYLTQALSLFEKIRAKALLAQES